MTQLEIQIIFQNSQFGLSAESKKTKDKTEGEMMILHELESVVDGIRDRLTRDIIKEGPLQAD